MRASIPNTEQLEMSENNDIKEEKRQSMRLAMWKYLRRQDTENTQPASVCTYFCVASLILFNCCSRATCLSGFSGILYVSETGAWNCAAFASYFSLEPLYTGCSGT